MLPNKWKRVWIGAGGIYVELILASIAAFMWFFTESGTTINDLCLNVMFLNLVSTVLVNGNPLLRFDGYYILMDFLEIPNLRQKSTEVLKRWFQATCLGLELQDDPFLPQRNRLFFGMFTIASVIYRWVVVFSIVWFVMQVLEPYGLQAIGRILAVAGFSGLVAQPVIQTWKFCRTPGRLSKVKRGPVLTSLAIAGAVVAAVCYIPLPHHIDAPFEIRPSEAGTVYAGVSGRIEDTLEPGTLVEPGDPIAVLKNPDLQIRLVGLQGERKVAEIQLDNLATRSRTDPGVVAQIETQEEMLQSINSLMAKTQEEIDRLTVRAKKAGVVILPPERADGDSQDGRLPGWKGTPLDKKNRGALMTPDDLICEVGSPDAFEAVLIIDQGDRQFVRLKQDVDLKLDAHRVEIYHGNVIDISKEPLKSASSSMSNATGGDLQTEIDPRTGQIKPRSVSYQARVPIDTSAMPILRPGFRGSAKIHVDPMSLGARLWRLIITTFNFDF